MELARQAGFKPYEREMALAAGDKIYRVNRDKSVMLAVIGGESLAQAHTSWPPISTLPGWT